MEPCLSRANVSIVVAGESTAGKDGSLMPDELHASSNARPEAYLEDCKCCISQHMQCEAAKELHVSSGFSIPPGETARKNDDKAEKSHN